MAENHKNISSFFRGVLGAPLRNSRWSWGAVNPNTGNLFLRVWADHRCTVDGLPCYLIFGDRWGATSAGRLERRKHIRLLRNGTLTFGVLCVPKDTKNHGREIKSFDSRNLVQFERLIEKRDSIYATITGQVPVTDIPDHNRIPPGITAADIRNALTALKRGDPHPFGKSTGYDLVHKGKRYPPKAVLGLAAARILGHSLRPRDFTGGEGSTCFRILRNFGFAIEPKRATANTTNNWTENEIRLLVNNYFAMLRLDRTGAPYNKAEYNRSLQQRLPGRTKDSIEYKYQSVTSVLHEEGFPCLPGYKRRRLYQRQLLLEIVLEHLGAGEGDVAKIQNALKQATPPKREQIDFATCEVPPPKKGPGPTKDTALPKQRRARKFDYARRDAANSKLGRAGEEFIVRRERWYLMSQGRTDLAEQVERVSDTRGDGLGYDILSFDAATGTEVYIEVKTTNCGQDFPFYASQGEVDASIELGQNYRLYRVFNFSTSPQFYVVPGDLRQGFTLRVRVYEVLRA